MPLSKTFLGTWETDYVSPSNPEYSSGNDNKWIRRKNMQGALLRVLGFKNLPYTTKDVDNVNATVNGSYGFEGITPDIVYALQVDFCPCLHVVALPLHNNVQWIVSGNTF